MGYTAADERGYLADVASNSGYAAFIRAVEPLKLPPVMDLLDDGWTEDPRGLAQALARVTFDNASAESVRAEIVAAASKAEGALIISDGTSDVELPNVPIEVHDYDFETMDMGTTNVSPAELVTGEATSHREGFGAWLFDNRNVLDLQRTTTTTVATPADRSETAKRAWVT